MSANEFTDTDHEDLAKRIVDKLVARMSDPETVEQITAVWGAHLDQSIGRAVRRAIWVMLGAIGLVVAIKIDAIVTWIKS